MGILSAFRFAFQNVFFTPLLYGVIASLAIFSATWERGDRLKDQLTDNYRSQQDTFDFIIVGGGSAGAVLAYRLSEHHSVLLLEAGGESHPFQAIPALSFFIPNYPATDWSHQSVKQTSSCLACVNKRYTFSQGKNLGGSGNLNYLIHLRGSPKDFDNWARITGDDRWNYENVLQDFCISENFVGTTTDTSAHGVGGPLQIEMPDEIGLANEWNLAGREMGYRHLDLNGRYEEGFDAIYYPIKRGVRQATYRAYILPARQKRSLLIRKFAHVNKILIREGTNDAYGVQYDRHGESKFAFANKEVIISAGTLQTPKILMLSGIGPREILEPCGIPVLSDLPVGKGLSDHISTLLGPFLINSPKTFSYDDDVTFKSFLQFTQQGKGPLTTSGFQATALIASSYAKAKGQGGWPDIQLTLFGISPHRLFNSDLAHAFGLRSDILTRFFSHARGKSAFFIIVTVARPESKGEVCIRSKDPHKPLIIDPKYFTDPTDKDMKVMIEGIHRAMFLAQNTTVFRNCGVKYAEKCFPGCEKHSYKSDAYWECYVRHLTITMNDHVGTAQMGYKTSPYAVLDPELKVMGVNHLRVVDASVMPTIVGANTQAATIMIGEKASKMILKDWQHDAGNFEQGAYGPPPTPEQYGPPPTEVAPASPQPQSTQTHSPNSVVVDDSLDSLTPPGLPGPDENYQGYDSFDLLRQKGLESVSNINLKGEPSPTQQIPAYSEPVVSVSTSTSSYPDYSPSTSEEVVTMPSIYQEIYDPSVATTPTATSQDEGSRPREPKAFDFDSETQVTPPENVLEEGEEYPTTTDAITAPTTTSTTESILMKGPNGSSLILRKRKRPPNVTVHPRGHLGYESEDRSPIQKSTTPSNPLTPSTSIQPLPTNYVVIKRRRPRVRRKRVRTKLTASGESAEGNLSYFGTTPLTPEEETTLRSPADLNRLRNFIPSNPRDKRDENATVDEMVIFEDLKVEEKTENVVEDNPHDKPIDNLNHSHPFMLMNMNPLPEILTESSIQTSGGEETTETATLSQAIAKSSVNSFRENRIKKMNKFIRRGIN